jgi:vacuolar-type H+-ATPase subunit D/Vma8
VIKELTKPRYSVDLADEPDIDVILDTTTNDYIDARDAAERMNELEAENKRLREALEDAKLQINYLDSLTLPHATTVTVIARIDHALDNDSV